MKDIRYIECEKCPVKCILKLLVFITTIHHVTTSKQTLPCHLTRAERSGKQIKWLEFLFFLQGDTGRLILWNWHTRQFSPGAQFYVEPPLYMYIYRYIYCSDCGGGGHVQWAARDSGGSIVYRCCGVIVAWLLPDQANRRLHVGLGKLP